MIKLAIHIFRACKNDVGKSKLKENQSKTPIPRKKPGR